MNENASGTSASAHTPSAPGLLALPVTIYIAPATSGCAGRQISRSAKSPVVSVPSTGEPSRVTVTATRSPSAPGPGAPIVSALSTSTPSVGTAADDASSTSSTATTSAHSSGSQALASRADTHNNTATTRDARTIIAAASVSDASPDRSPRDPTRHRPADPRTAAGIESPGHLDITQ